MRIIDRAGTGLPPLSLRTEPLNAPASVEIASEHVMDLFIDGRFALRIVCTPEHLPELAAGRMVTEGWVRNKEDIRSIEVGECGLRADVTLTHELAAPLEAPAVMPRPWEEAWLRQAAERMRGQEALYSRTHAAHSCYLGRGNGLLCCREDIGRHNALDKAVGYALIQGIGRADCYLFISGRMPADMVLKAARADIPLLASKAYPTNEGIALARRAGITLVTLRPDGALLIWTDGTERKDRQ